MNETMGRAETRAAVQIDFLYWEDCPSHERALELLNEVIRDEGIQADLRVQRVETDEDAERLAFPGSPTILVGGEDIVEHTDLPIGLTCRVYINAAGRMSPLPPREAIAAALRHARASGTA